MNTLTQNNDEKRRPGDARSPDRHWLATLDVRIEARGDQSLLKAARHFGPLRVQKPYRQADGSLHVYLLHPPGGVVGGDELTMTIACGPGTRTLFTSPAAGKFYRCLTGSEQVQTVRLLAEPGAHLEWLPQETIFFNGARARLLTEVSLAEDSTYLGWDIQYLGRETAGESFEEGYIEQSTRVHRAGQLLHRERQRYTAEMIRAPWGPGGRHVIGTLVAVPLPGQRSLAEAAVKEMQTAMNVPEWGVTWRGRTMLVRYVGGSAEECRAGFEQARQLLAKASVFAGRELNDSPRIWNT